MEQLETLLKECKERISFLKNDESYYRDNQIREVELFIFRIQELMLENLNNKTK